MGHLKDWGEYCGKVVAQYKDRVHDWEIWNEGNGGFKGHYPDGHMDSTADYAKLTATAYEAIKKSDPAAKVGLSVASFDAPYLDQTVLEQAKLGKPESFDFLCIHPYETIGGLTEVNGEVSYLWMAKMLRDALKVDAPDRPNPEIWITEIGRRIGDEKESKEKDAVTEEVAAVTLVKAYIMAIAEGIQRVSWFEAEDPHGEPPGYGLLRIDGTPRPSLTAMKSMTALLGPTPKNLGWLALGKDGRSYGFAFQGKSGPVLVLWMPLGETDKTISFSGEVKVTDPLTGSSTTFGAGKPLDLTDKPVLVANIPADIVAQAQVNAGKNFPWGGDYTGAKTVSIQLGDSNIDKGITQVNLDWTKPYKFADGSTGAVVSQPGKHDNQNIKFVIHPSFADIKTHDYYLRVTARRISPNKTPESYCKMDLVYEVADSKGQGGPMRIAGRVKPELYQYEGEITGDEFALADDTAKWQTHTWHLTDASFSKMWGYDFAFLIDKSDPFVIGKVEVSTQPFGE